MKKILVPKPVSAGILLSYKCTSECKHCMYACSTRWKRAGLDALKIIEAIIPDHPTIEQVKKSLAQLKA